MFTTPKRSLMRYAIFSQTGPPPRQVDCLAPLLECGRKMCFPRHNDALPSSGTESRVGGGEAQLARAPS